MSNKKLNESFLKALNATRKPKVRGLSRAAVKALGHTPGKPVQLTLKYFPVNAAWAFIHGRTLTDARPLQLGDERMFYPSRKEAVAAAKRRGLKVDKKGVATSDNTKKNGTYGHAPAPSVGSKVTFPTDTGSIRGTIRSAPYTAKSKTSFAKKGQQVVDVKPTAEMDLRFSSGFKSQKGAGTVAVPLELLGAKSNGRKAKKGTYGVRQETINIYKFEELPDEQAKDKARDWYRQGGLDHEWWDSTYDDAKNIGLKITGFDLDRGLMAEGDFTEDAVDVAKAIMKDHGKKTETYSDAEDFLEEWKQGEKAYLKANKDDPEYLDESPFEDSDEAEKLEAEFQKTILEDYARMLQSEYDYLNSDEAVDESIIANEYEFHEDGSIA